MERYFGSLLVDRRKIHVSLVSCLRNQRSMKKKKYEESFSSNNNNKDSENMDQINELDDFEADG